MISAVSQSGHKIKGSFKYCIDEAGHVTHIAVLESTHAASYDMKIAKEMARWAFQPVIGDGKPIAVCSVATFIFTAS